MLLEIVESALYVPKYYYGALFGLGFCGYYLLEVAKVPSIVCKKGAFRDFLEDNIPTLKSRFWPTFWCFESRAQTIFASILRSMLWSNIKYHREIFTLSDGGEVALDWAKDNCSSTSPIIIILPGLTGASQSEYVKCLVHAAKTRSIKCVIFNYRGLGGVKLKTPRLYSAANYDDLSEVIEYVRRFHQNVPIAAAGISLGGLILGNYLAKEGKAALGKIKAGFAISIPWNIFEGTKSIEKPYLNLMLNRHLCSNLRKTIQQNFFDEKNFLGNVNVDLETVMKSTTVREFDQHFTSRHFGYRDVDEYYADATLHNKLHQIQIPFLCLSAADDPFQPIKTIPLKEVTKNVAIILTSRGGHIGFLEGLWPVKEQQYFGKIFGEYFSSIFGKEL